MNVEPYLIDVLNVSQEDRIHAQRRAEKNKTTLEFELRDMGLLTHEEYTQAMAHVYGVSHISLTSKHVSPEHFTALPEPVSRIMRAIVYGEKDGRLLVAVEHLDSDTKEKLAEHLEQDFDLFLTDEQSISYVLGTYQTYLREHYGEKIAHHARRLEPLDSYAHHGDLLPTRYIAELQDSFDALKITELLFSVMQTMQAEDIYIDRGVSNTEISMRFGSTKLPTMNLDEHIFDRLLWVYAKQADVDLRTIEGPLMTVHLPTPDHIESSGIMRARLTFVVTAGVITHMHINAEKTSQLFTSLEVLFPSQAQSQQLLAQMNSGPLVLCSEHETDRKRVYYSLLERYTRLSKRVTSLEVHVDVNIPEVMQLGVGAKKDLHTLMSSAESLKGDVVALSEQHGSRDLYLRLARRLDHTHLISLDSARTFFTLDLDYAKPVGFITQESFTKLQEADMRPLSQDEKMLCKKILGDRTHVINLDDHYADGDFEYKGARDNKVHVQGFTTHVVSAQTPRYEKVRGHLRSALIEHALIRSSQGEISIQEILSYAKR